MKKVLIISFLIFTILFSFLSTSYAAVAVTGDKIFDFFKKLENSNLTIKQVREGFSYNKTISFDEIKITHESNKIIFTAPDNSINFELNYTINNNKVFFSSARTFNIDDMKDLDQAMNEAFTLTLIKYTSSCAFLSIADIQATDLSIAYAYFSNKLQTTNEEDKKEISDDVFHYSETNTDNSFSYNLEINLNNWSNVNSTDATGYTVTFDKLDINNEETNNQPQKYIEVSDLQNLKKYISGDGSAEKNKGNLYFHKDGYDGDYTLLVAEKNKLTENTYKSIISIWEVMFDSSTKAVDYFKDNYSSLSIGNKSFYGFKVEINPTKDDWEEMLLGSDNTYKFVRLTIDKNTIVDLLNINANQQETVDKITSSTSKLPQTGDFFNVKGALLFLILACAAGIMILIIPNVKYRNTNIKQK